MRNSTAAILLVLAVTLPAASGARAQADCEDWTENMSWFFYLAEAENVAYCLAAGASLDAQDDRGWKPLHHAALQLEKPGVVGVLLTAGADPGARSDLGDTPLHHAASGGELEAVGALLAAGADPNARSDLGYTPLHSAAFRGHLEAVEALLAAGADPSVRLYSFTPLLMAEIAGHMEVVAVLRPAGSGLGNAVASALREELPAARSGSGAGAVGRPSSAAASAGTGRGIGSKLFSALRDALGDALKRKLRDLLRRELGKALDGAGDGIAVALIGGVLNGEDSDASTAELLAALSRAEALDLPVGEAAPGGTGDEFGYAVASALRDAKAGTDAGSVGVGDKLISSLRDGVRGALRRELDEALGGAEDGVADSLIGGLLDGKDVEESTAELLAALPGPGASNTLAGATAPSNASGVVGDAGSRDTGLSAGKEFMDCRDCPEMVVVPAGSFRMGCVSGLNCIDAEKPVRRVAISTPFALSKHEVTFAQWDACAASGGCGGYSPVDWGWDRGGRPVIFVSWEDAQSFVAWLSRVTGEAYRLPTESEWEYAARAGTETKYSWGNSIENNRANCDGCGSQWSDEMTAPVGSFGANAFGLHDMHGNVWEWVEDCWNDSYAGAPSDGSAWLSGNCERRVLRGGAWNGYPGDLRSAFRSWDSTGDRNDYGVGFRVARTLAP